MPFGCRGHDFGTKGVRGCALDTAHAAVGTTFTLKFMVFDNQFPPKSANVTRTLHIVSPCQAAEAFCPSLSPQCGTSGCAVRHAISAGSPVDATEFVFKHLRFDNVLLPMFTGANEAGPLALVHVPPHWPPPIPLAFCAGATPGCGVLWGDASTQEQANVRLFSRLQVPDRLSVHACSSSKLLAGECPAGQHTMLYQAFQSMRNASDVAQVDVQVGTPAASFSLNVSAAVELPGTVGAATRTAVLAALSGSTHATHAALHAAAARMAHLSQAWLLSAAGARVDDELTTALAAPAVQNATMSQDAVSGKFDFAVRA